MHTSKAPGAKASPGCVSWKGGSAILVTFFGTEDEGWDFIDDQGRIRGYRLDAGR